MQTDSNGLIVDVTPLQNGSFGSGLRLTLTGAELEGWGLQGDERLRVILRSEFVTDERDLPVDGAHVGGKLPTTGRFGGVLFESWFLT